MAQQQGIRSDAEFWDTITTIKASLEMLEPQIREGGRLRRICLDQKNDNLLTALERNEEATQLEFDNIEKKIDRLEKGTESAYDKDTAKKKQIVRQRKTLSDHRVNYRQMKKYYNQQKRAQDIRQFQIVYPGATDAQLQEAADTDWGNGGVFKAAFQNDQSATADQALRACQTRHNAVRKIESDFVETYRLLEDLHEHARSQAPAVERVEQSVENVGGQMENGNIELSKKIKHGKSDRKRKWWCCGIGVAIMIILVLVLALYFTLIKTKV